MKYRIPVGLMVAMAAISVAFAQTAAPAKTPAEAKAAVDARHAHFESIKKAYEPLGAMLKPVDRGGKEVDPAVVVSTAPKLVELANGIPGKFAVDTRGFKDLKTDARDAIWASAADFKAKSDAMATAVNAAAAVAKSGDKGATKKAIADIGKTCGACHDSFKAKAN
jgi:cytochrome c556